MPIGIKIINSMSKHHFRSPAELADLIESYFKPYELADQVQTTDAKKQTQHFDPMTMSGLAYHLGFDSLASYEAYEAKAKYAHHLKRAKLRIIAEYEKKLHVQSSTGAIFILRILGYGGPTAANTDTDAEGNFKVEIVHTGTRVAGDEKDVTL